MNGRRSSEWLVALTGLAAVALFVAAFAIAGEGPDATEESAREVVDFYVENEGAMFAASALAGLAAISVVFFGGYLRKVLRSAEGENGILSAVALAGAVVLAVAFMIVASINVALADTADDVDPVAVQALNAIVWDYFIPFAVGMSVLTLSSGVSIVRHGALPKWLGWVAVLIGVAAATPAGFFAFVVGGLWILVISVLLAQRARAAA